MGIFFICARYLHRERSLRLKWCWSLDMKHGVCIKFNVLVHEDGSSMARQIHLDYVCNGLSDLCVNISSLKQISLSILHEYLVQ